MGLWNTRIFSGHVSIPFKRESVSEQVTKLSSKQERRLLCFNSLQTGKRIWTKETAADGKVDFGFNSLQTGKHIWTKTKKGERHWNTLVSIPFKRESVSEPTGLWLKILMKMFQFPSNGKAYLNFPTKEGEMKKNKKKFQFPSNGKAYLNEK